MEALCQHVNSSHLGHVSNPCPINGEDFCHLSVRTETETEYSSGCPETFMKLSLLVSHFETKHQQFSGFQIPPTSRILKPLAAPHMPFPSPGFIITSSVPWCKELHDWQVFLPQLSAPKQNATLPPTTSSQTLQPKWSRLGAHDTKPDEEDSDPDIIADIFTNL